MTTSTLLADLARASKAERMLAAQERHERTMSLVLGSNRGVNAVLGSHWARTCDFAGKDMMRAFGPAMKGIDVAGITRGVVRSRGLPDGADIAGITRGVVKSQGLLRRAGLRDVLREVNTGTGRIAVPSVTSRVSLATAGLLAARTASGKDIMRWTPGCACGVRSHRRGDALCGHQRAACAALARLCRRPRPGLAASR